jgi:hypothetical protein
MWGMERLMVARGGRSPRSTRGVLSTEGWKDLEPLLDSPPIDQGFCLRRVRKSRFQILPSFHPG